jgi:hypothetical protein
MLDPHSARTPEDCMEIASRHAGGYPLCLGWTACLEPLLPDPVVRDGGRSHRRCIAFFVDEELGPHFVFDDDDGLRDVPLAEVGFDRPLSSAARLWLRAFHEWRNGMQLSLVG